jgi:hypothetical protein
MESSMNPKVVVLVNVSRVQGSNLYEKRDAQLLRHGDETQLKGLINITRYIDDKSILYSILMDGKDEKMRVSTILLKPEKEEFENKWSKYWMPPPTLKQSSSPTVRAIYSIGPEKLEATVSEQGNHLFDATFDKISPMPEQLPIVNEVDEEPEVTRVSKITSENLEKDVELRNKTWETLPENDRRLYRIRVQEQLEDSETARNQDQKIIESNAEILPMEGASGHQIEKQEESPELLEPTDEKDPEQQSSFLASVVSKLKELTQIEQPDKTEEMDEHREIGINQEDKITNAPDNGLQEKESAQSVKLENEKETLNLGEIEEIVPVENNYPDELTMRLNEIRGQKISDTLPEETLEYEVIPFESGHQNEERTDYHCQDNRFTPQESEGTLYEKLEEIAKLLQDMNRAQIQMHEEVMEKINLFHVGEEEKVEIHNHLEMDYRAQHHIKDLTESENNSDQ